MAWCVGSLWPGSNQGEDSLECGQGPPSCLRDMEAYVVPKGLPFCYGEGPERKEKPLSVCELTPGDLRCPISPANYRFLHDTKCLKLEWGKGTRVTLWGGGGKQISPRIYLGLLY